MRPLCRAVPDRQVMAQREQPRAHGSTHFSNPSNAYFHPHLQRWVNKIDFDAVWRHGVNETFLTLVTSSRSKILATDLGQALAIYKPSPVRHHLNCLVFK